VICRIGIPASPSSSRLPVDEGIEAALHSRPHFTPPHPATGCARSTPPASVELENQAPDCATNLDRLTLPFIEDTCAILPVCNYADILPSAALVGSVWKLVPSASRQTALSRSQR